MEPEDSLLCSQVPVTSPYPDPDKSSPHPSISSFIFHVVRLSDQNFLWISHLSLVCCLLQPSHSPWFFHPNNVWWKTEMMKLLIMQFSPVSWYFFPFRSKYILSSLFSNLCSSLNVREQVSPWYWPSVLLSWVCKWHNVETGARKKILALVKLHTWNMHNKILFPFQQAHWLYKLLHIYLLSSSDPSAIFLPYIEILHMSHLENIPDSHNPT
jgi:hypothetical protein